MKIMKLSEIQLVSEIQALFSENNEYDAIKADIAERGIQDPVKVNKHNQLLAGYTRVKIAQELGLDEVPHIVVDVEGDINDMIEYAILDNIRRRQLTDLQLVEYGMKLEKLYEGRQGRPEKGGQNVHVFEGKTRDLVADKLAQETGERMSGKKYERLKTIATKAAKEVKEQYNRGEITQDEALEFSKISIEVQQDIIAGGRGAWFVKEYLAKARRDESEEKYSQLERTEDEIALEKKIVELWEETAKWRRDNYLWKDSPVIEEWENVRDVSLRFLQPSNLADLRKKTTWVRNIPIENRMAELNEMLRSCEEWARDLKAECERLEQKSLLETRRREAISAISKIPPHYLKHVYRELMKIYHPDKLQSLADDKERVLREEIAKYLTQFGGYIELI